MTDKRGETTDETMYHPTGTTGDTAGAVPIWEGDGERAPGAATEQGSIAGEPAARGEAGEEGEGSGDEQLQQLTEQLTESREAHLRAVADLQNFRRRSLDEREQLIQLANENLISDLLPVLDNFERAIECPVEGEAALGLLKGVCMTQQQLQGVLESYGLQRVATVGEQFDPACHEAVARVDNSEQPEGTIVGEVMPGYLLKGRLLRAAQVQVAG
jgi:molecular chaperone GrpE